MIPDWLTALAMAYLALAFLCAVVAVAMLIVRPQMMAVMNAVWPVTALYWGPLGVWALWEWGAPPVNPARRRHQPSHESMASPRHQPTKPFWQQVCVGVTHCGAGCTLGDIIGEWLVYAFGWHLLGGMLYAEYIVDFALAYLLGIVFQYFSIVPMRGLGFRDGVVAAVKADTVSIIAFEIGLFGWMALTYFVLFPGGNVASWNHWFQMQIGMMIGFFTSFPATWFLLRKGLKEPM